MKYIFKHDEFVPEDHFFYLKPSLWYGKELEKLTIFVALNIRLTPTTEEKDDFLTREENVFTIATRYSKDNH